MAWSDREWVLEGAAVKVSIVGFDRGTESAKYLDGQLTSQINEDLTSVANIRTAFPLHENLGICFPGPVVVWQHGRAGTDLNTALQDDRPRYTPTTPSKLFPSPGPPRKENTRHPTYKRVAEAAKELNDLRERWLNPPELLEPLARILDAQDDFSDVPAEARPLIRHSALMAEAAKSPNLEKRTLTNLYNVRPTWLKRAHEKLDRAVLAAYAHIDPAGGSSVRRLGHPLHRNRRRLPASPRPPSRRQTRRDRPENPRQPPPP